MKKLLFAFFAGIFYVLGVVSVGAADITIAENGKTEYKIGAASTWLEVDKNAATYADYVKILESYSGIDFEEFDPLVKISDKEIVVGYTKEAGRHKTRMKNGDIYTLTEDLNGLEEAFFAYDHYNSDYYEVLHARIQFFTWLKHNVPTLEKFHVFSELIK